MSQAHVVSVCPSTFSCPKLHEGIQIEFSMDGLH